VGELGLYATWTLDHLYNHCARVNARVVTWLRFNFFIVFLLLLHSCTVPLWLITVNIHISYISDLISATWLSPSRVHSACFYPWLWNMGCPNKSARFKVCTIVILLGWRHWKFDISHLSLLRLVVMECCNKEQHIIIVKTHYRYGESYAETVRKVHGIFGQRNAPYQSTVQRMNK